MSYFIILALTYNFSFVTVILRATCYCAGSVRDPVLRLRRPQDDEAHKSISINIGAWSEGEGWSRISFIIEKFLTVGLRSGVTQI